jgi:hypothetical protein
LGTRETVRYPATVLGLILIAYWWETTGLRFPSPRLYHFYQPVFLIGLVLVVVGVYLIATTARENT